MAHTWRIAKSIAIEADASRVWDVLVNPASIKRWLADCELEVAADWVVGGAMTSWGDWHGLPLENKSRIVAIEPENRLVYTHWSSLSQLADREENYSLIRMELTDAVAGTTLALWQENLLTAEIYGHWNFYWNMALPRIKRLAESGQL